MSGRIQVITGPMFSGKTTLLIEEAKALWCQWSYSISLYTHSSNERQERDLVFANHQVMASARRTTDPLLHAAEWPASARHAVVIDEAQFFGRDIVRIANELRRLGKIVLIGGLDYDMHGVRWWGMAELEEYAARVTRLTAGCARCERRATRTQRLRPASSEAELIESGPGDYEPRCLGCFQPFKFSAAGGELRYSESVGLPTSTLTFQQLREKNRARCEASFHPLADWSPTDWGCAMGGECGEAQNKIKKLRRLDTAKNIVAAEAEQLRAHLGKEIKDEIGDTLIYADLLAQRLGFRLEDAVRDKFNQKSREIESPFFLE